MAAGQLTPKQLFERRNLPYIYFVMRPLGRSCLPLAMRLGLTPNQITLVSILISLLGMALLATGGLTLSLVGVASVHLGLVLDMVDGDLARLTGKASRRGEFLDALGGYLREGLLLPAMGIGLARSPDLGHQAITAVIDLPLNVYGQIGVWAAFFYLNSRLITLSYRVLFQASVRESSGKLGRASLMFENLLPPLALVGAATQYLTPVLLVYASYYGAAGLYTILTTYLKAGSTSES